MLIWHGQNQNGAPHKKCAQGGKCKHLVYERKIPFLYCLNLMLTFEITTIACLYKNYLVFKKFISLQSFLLKLIPNFFGISCFKIPIFMNTYLITCLFVTNWQPNSNFSLKHHHFGYYIRETENWSFIRKRKLSVSTNKHARLMKVGKRNSLIHSTCSKDCQIFHNGNHQHCFLDIDIVLKGLLLLFLLGNRPIKIPYLLFKPNCQ
jgi:hypothetical protein